MSNEKQRLLSEDYLKFILETFFDGVSLSDLRKTIRAFRVETGRTPICWIVRAKKENRILGLPVRFVNEGECPELDEAFIKGKLNFGIAGEMDRVLNRIHVPKNETIN